MHLSPAMYRFLRSLTAPYTRLSGFTLLEMLLAVTILAVIVVILGGAMRLGYRSAEKGERKIESAERVRRTIEIVESQIQALLPLTVKEQAERKPNFSGDRKTLTISTNYSMWDGRKGYILAEYTVKSEASGRESLFLKEKPLGVETATEILLLKDCSSVEFAYLEKGLTKEDAKWIERWNSEETVPERIKIAIKFGAWNYSLVVPVRVGRET